MTFRSRLLATAVPVACVSACAVPAVAAASKVSVRVEGARQTLLAPRDVTVPASGSIIRDGAPSGACPADSAAGALQAATHGRWGGTWYSSYHDFLVDSILGSTAKGASYWEFFVNDRPASEGVCETTLKPGAQVLFAEVPAKGTEHPIVLTAPRTVRAGHEFRVRTFYDTGSGNATRPVKVSLRAVAGHARGKQIVRVGVTSTTSRGFTDVTLGPAGTTYTLTASAKGEIRSAPVTIKVVK